MQLNSGWKASGSLAFLLAIVITGAVQAAPEIVEACKSCHAEDGAGVGKAIVPIIAGMPAVHIEEALYAYKDGARQCLEEPVMCDTATFHPTIQLSKTCSDRRCMDSAPRISVTP